MFYVVENCFVRLVKVLPTKKATNKAEPIFDEREEEIEALNQYQERIQHEKARSGRSVEIGRLTPRLGF